MALVKCRECETSVSSKAKTCPHCGVSDPSGSKAKVSALVGIGLGLLVSVLALATCNKKATTTATDAPPSSTSGRNSENEMFLRANAADQHLMKTWEAQNELCQGEIDAPNVDTICQRRKTTETALKRRGWCWDFADRGAFESEWHRCILSAPLPVEISYEQFDAFEIGIVAGGSLEDQQAVEATQLYASSALRRFEKLLEPINRDLGTANALVACGIRDEAWGLALRRKLAESMASDPAYSEAKAALSRSERVASEAYATRVMRFGQQFVGGDGSPARCQGISADPFVVSFDSYLAGQAETLPSGVGAISQPSVPSTDGSAMGRSQSAGVAEDVQLPADAVSESNLPADAPLANRAESKPGED